VVNVDVDGTALLADLGMARAVRRDGGNTIQNGRLSPEDVLTLGMLGGARCDNTFGTEVWVQPERPLQVGTLVGGKIKFRGPYKLPKLTDIVDKADPSPDTVDNALVELGELMTHALSGEPDAVANLREALDKMVKGMVDGQR
jgi:hypothetical protein